MKVHVRRIKNGNGIVDMPERISKGDWIDLMTLENVSMYSNQYREICLGIAMELPEGMEAVVVPRSSTPRKWKIMCANSIGVIDNTYCGNNDEWRFPAWSIDAVEIPARTRIAQFRIQPSQFATPWQKIRWMFTRNIEFVEVDVLCGPSRGGLGST